MAIVIGDPRPGQVLRCIADGMTAIDAAKQCTVDRKTIYRWRKSLGGFDAAFDRLTELAQDGDQAARAEANMIVQGWTPGGYRSDSTPSPPDVAEPLPTQAQVELPAVQPPVPEAVIPDVILADGREISRPPPALACHKRLPTPEEWVDKMEKIFMDKKQPERLRLGALASASSAVLGGPHGHTRRLPEIDEQASRASQERGRDPGVPASVWQEARVNFLGPAPEPAPEDEQSGDVVEFERAPS